MRSNTGLLNVLISYALVALFGISIAYNSVSYTVKAGSKTVDVLMHGKVIHIPRPPDNTITIHLDPQPRYTLGQYLVEDYGPIQNTFQILNHIIHRDDANADEFRQPIGSTRAYIHFNPFKAAFYINSAESSYHIETNIPDGTLQVWDNLHPFKNISIKPPWIRLITAPLVTALAVTVFIIHGCYAYMPNRHKKYLQKQSRIFLSFKKNLSLHASVLILFLIAWLACVAITLLVYHGMPGFGDEMNYLLQARIFASGHLSVKQPLHASNFMVDWMDMYGQDGRIWGFHGLGNSIVLAIGWIVGIPWITIPFVFALLLVIQYLLALELFQRRSIAWVHVILMLTSHYILSISGSYMAHAPSLLFISIFYYALARVIRRNEHIFLIIAAAAIGFAFDVRPLSAVLSAFVPSIVVVGYWIKTQKKVPWGIVIMSVFIGGGIAELSYAYTYILTKKWELSYLVKGPETGRTIMERWGEGWQYRLANLYRNLNEFQHRVHSGSFLGNFILFFTPLFLRKSRRDQIIVAIGYLSLVFYIVVHSFLHFYGWMWEPRMLYDISFIFFLISAYGFVCAADAMKHKQYGSLIWVGGILAIGLVIIIDLPYRFSTQYHNYNAQPPYIRTIIQKKHIHNALILFENKEIYAPYAPFNDINFNGDIVYAVAQNNKDDDSFIATYKGRRIFFTSDGVTLHPYVNFFHRDIYRLEQDVAALRRNYDVLIVVPDTFSGMDTRFTDLGATVLYRSQLGGFNTDNPDLNTRNLVMVMVFRIDPYVDAQWVYGHYNPIIRNGYETPVNFFTIKDGLIIQ